MRQPGEKWVPIAQDETFTCRCGVVKDGSKVGKRGGRQWKVRVGIVEYCSHECARDYEALDAAEDAGRGEFEAEMGEMMAGGPDA